MSVNWGSINKDIFTEILSWAEPEDVLAMSVVCKRWRALILSHSCQQTYLRKALIRCSDVYPVDLEAKSSLAALKTNLAWVETLNGAKECVSLERLQYYVESNDPSEEVFDFTVYNGDDFKRSVKLEEESYRYLTSEEPYKPGAVIKKKMNPNVVAKVGRYSCRSQTPLHKFAEEGDLEKCRVLLGNGASANIKNKDRETPLDLAVQEEHYGVALLLLKHGVSCDVKNISLYGVIESGEEELVELLVEKGANAAPAFKKRSLLHLACERGQLRSVKALVNAGANMDSVFDEDGYSPLEIAVYYGLTEIVQFMIESGANPKVTDNCILEARLLWPGLKPLHSSLGGLPTEIQEFPIYQAVIDGDVKQLSEMYFNGHEEWNLLDIASSHGQLEVINFLLEVGDKIDHRYHPKRTALMFAAINGQTEAARLLIAEGADVSLRDRFKKNALDYALQHWPENVELKRLLKRKKVKVTKPSQQLVTRRLRNTPLSNRDELGRTLLTQAIVIGNYDAADLLLGKGAKLDEVDDTGQTSLHHAVQMKNLGAVEYLLKNGASHTIRDMGGRTPLHIAKAYGHKKIISLLNIAGYR